MPGEHFIDELPRLRDIQFDYPQIGIAAPGLHDPGGHRIGHGQFGKLVPPANPEHGRAQRLNAKLTGYHCNRAGFVIPARQNSRKAAGTIYPPDERIDPDPAGEAGQRDVHPMRRLQ